MDPKDYVIPRVLTTKEKPPRKYIRRNNKNVYLNVRSDATREEVVKYLMSHFKLRKKPKKKRQPAKKKEEPKNKYKSIKAIAQIINHPGPSYIPYQPYPNRLDIDTNQLIAQIREANMSRDKINNDIMKQEFDRLSKMVHHQSSQGHPPQKDHDSDNDSAVDDVLKYQLDQLHQPIHLPQFTGYQAPKMGKVPAPAVDKFRMASMYDPTAPKPVQKPKPNKFKSYEDYLSFSRPATSVLHIQHPTKEPQTTPTKAQAKRPPAIATPHPLSPQLLRRTGSQTATPLKYSTVIRNLVLPQQPSSARDAPPANMPANASILNPPAPKTEAPKQAEYLTVNQIKAKKGLTKQVLDEFIVQVRALNPNVKPENYADTVDGQYKEINRYAAGNPEVAKELRRVYDAFQKHKQSNKKGKKKDTFTFKISEDQSGSGLYTDQIIDGMVKIPQFIGCIARDQINTLIPLIKPHTRIAFVINLDPHDMPGSHWCAVVMNGTAHPPDPYSMMYFDPFGRNVPSDILRDMKMAAQKISPNEPLMLKVSRVQHQKKTINGVPTETCGFHSMAFILKMFTRNHESFAEATGYRGRIEDKSGKYEAEIARLRKVPPFKYIHMQEGGEDELDKEDAKEEPKEEPKKEEPKEEPSKVEQVANTVTNAVDKAKKVKAVIDDIIPPPRDVAPPGVRKFVEEHKDWNFQSVQVARAPIFSVIQKTINLLRKVTFQKADPKYDNLFHLYMIITLKDPNSAKSVTFKMERNEVFNLTQSVSAEDRNPKKGGVMSASSPKQPFGIVLNKAVASQKDNFWRYDSINNNCQDMVLSFLRAGGVLSSGLQTFIKQNVKQLLPKFLTDAAKWATDKAHGVDVLINGKGDKKLGSGYKKFTDAELKDIYPDA